MSIGLDIGSSAVRAVQLRRRRGGPPALSRYGEVLLPPEAVADGDVVEEAVVAEALRTLWRQAGLRSRTVAVGLASQRVTVREIELPDLPAAELAQAARLQAQEQLPMPVEEALLDHVVVESLDRGDQRPNLRVLLVAAEKDVVERLLGAVTGAKLRPALVDLDAFALVRSLSPPPAGGQDVSAVEEVQLAVDVGATITKIVVHRGGTPLFVRMLRLGGDAATRELEKVLDLSWPEAERAKLEASTALAAGADADPDDERARVLQNAVRRVVTEVRHSLEFFRGQHEDMEVGRVVLSGGASLAPNIADQLQGALELPVEPADPLRALAGRVPDGLEDKAPFLSVPVGLAMGLL